MCMDTHTHLVYKGIAGEWMVSVGWTGFVREAGGCVAVQTVASPSLSGLMHADHSLLAHTLAWLEPVPPVGWM